MGAQLGAPGSRPRARVTCRQPPGSGGRWAAGLCSPAALPPAHGAAPPWLVGPAGPWACPVKLRDAEPHILCNPLPVAKPAAAACPAFFALLLPLLPILSIPFAHPQQARKGAPPRTPAPAPSSPPQRPSSPTGRSHATRAGGGPPAAGRGRGARRRLYLPLRRLPNAVHEGGGAPRGPAGRQEGCGRSAMVAGSPRPSEAPAARLGRLPGPSGARGRSPAA